jgi:tetratricopeptide (TPR) repeat protein
MEQEAEALSDFDRALEIDPSNVPALLGRCRTRGALGDWNGAGADASLVLQRDPSSIDALVEIGIARCHIPGGWRDGEAEFTRAIALDPLGLRPRLERAKARLKFGDKNGALKDFEYVLARTTESSSDHCESLLGRAAIRWGGGDRSMVIADIAELVLRAPMPTLRFLSGGENPFEGGERREVLAWLADKGPTSAEWFDNLGCIQIGLGYPADARASLRRASELDPGIASAVFYFWVLDAQDSGGGVAAAARLKSRLESAAGPKLTPAQAAAARLLCGEADESGFFREISGLAGSPEEQAALLPQACFYAGMKRLAEGDPEGARSRLREAVWSGPENSVERNLARLELKALANFPAAAGETRTASEGAR